MNYRRRQGGKIKFMNCLICNKQAVYRFSPDLIDIEGLGACKEHFYDVFYLYGILIKEGVKEFKKELNKYES